MAQPTQEQLMKMLQRIDNKLNHLLRKESKSLNLALFDTLPKKQLDLWSNEDEFKPALCSKHLSLWHCRNKCNLRPCDKMYFSIKEDKWIDSQF